MKFRRIYLSFLLVCLVISMMPIVKATTEVLVDTYTDTSDSLDGLVEPHPATVEFAMSAMGQTFIQTRSHNVNLTVASFYLQIAGIPIGNLTARLCSLTGTYGVDAIPDETLAESEKVDMESLSEIGDWYNFTFTGANQYTMTALSQYGIYVFVLENTTLDGENFIEVFGNTESAPSGNSIAYYGVAEWSCIAEQATSFAVYGNEEASSWRDSSNSAVVTVATILLPIVYMIGTALFFIHEKEKPNIKEIMVIAVGFILVTVLFPIGMNVLLA